MCCVLIPSALVACSLLVGSLLILNRSHKNNEIHGATNQSIEVDNSKFESEIWFGELGCLNIGDPWTTLLRPVPPPMGPEDNPTVVYFYSWRNKTKRYVITLYPDVHIGGAPFDGHRPTTLIIHGYKSNTITGYHWIRNLKDVYLKNVDANIFLVDWGPGSATGILQATSNARVVAKLLVRLLKHLMYKRALLPEKIHLIGHSLGAHVASYVAKEIPGIPRLTALDPAQPAFEGYDKEVRLDKTDAAFVEVIHTNAKPFIPSLGFGMVKPHGHVDFYFNDGGDQPGCTVPDEIPQIHSLRDVVRFHLDYDIYTFICSHVRAYEYLIEAYNKTNSCVFWGHRATAKVYTDFASDKHNAHPYSNFSMHSHSCTEENCIPFGLDTINSPLRGVFVVKTNSHSPFCVFQPNKLTNESYIPRR